MSYPNEDPEPSPSPELLRAGRNLRIDARSLEVARAFAAADISCMLLKGPVFARWLYEQNEIRDYHDTDLLVAPHEVDRAETVLARLGFSLPEIYEQEDRPSTEHTWVRSTDEAVVDLHWGITGMEVEPAKVWETLHESCVMMPLRGREIPALGPAATALHVVLHAAQHGNELHKTLEDLERALTRADMDLWREASSLAEVLNATTAFAAGLRLDARGREVAEALGLPDEISVEVALRSEGAPPLALGLDWFLKQPGWRGKVGVLFKNLFPSPGFMKVWNPLARRGWVGLSLAYLWRPVALLKEAVPATKALVKARRRSGRGT
jgi:hypothetical protein